MHRLPIDSCRDFWQLASDYHNTANLVFEKNKSISDFPRDALIGHALELYLKAYLRSQGDDIKALKSIGHNLKKALEMAERKGLSNHLAITSSDRDLLAKFSLVYSSKDFEYRRQGGWELPLPAWTFDFAARLSRCVERFANRAS